ncbi:hypothetical protein CfE428DRAFT_5532 [Chthoniobacter flavus Ellin428]|uniref:Uncharacterized protein n=1 Tax=Chthoniobacter flavus Ellin428 TaxID=497964 RepID=B4D9E2_9BACT|nr:hypothetical protein [Chthoniobacter flavus]EDY16903.1 hypothetical protein CfE428DRAFT_5532 [Chthoniobacter flavus Ellin428]TCO87785.1 hypothetical protein EV701_12084 [Chthoniobacter flavus]
MGERLAGYEVSIFGRRRELAAQPVIVANGFSGGDFIADNVAHTGNWTTIDVLTDVVLDSSTVCNISGLAASSATLPAGKQIFGSFTSITLTSGSIIAYR